MVRRVLTRVGSARPPHPLPPPTRAESSNVRAADFDGDGETDIAVPIVANTDPQIPKVVSLGAPGEFQPVAGRQELSGTIALGRYNDRAGVDALLWQGNSRTLTSWR
jgi:hypothetical protein